MNKLLLLLALTLLSIVTSAQIRMTKVDPASSLITIRNFGSVTVNIQQYRLCALFEYSSLSGPSVTLADGIFNLGPGASVTIEWAASSGFNPTSSDLGLYLPMGAYSDPANMVDFMQYGTSGQGREGVAQAAGLWSAGAFVTGAGPWVYTGNGNQNGIDFWAAFGGPGCTAVDACNYDPTASVEDFSCLYIGFPCDDGNPLTVDVIDANCNCTGIPTGCIDSSACNYNPEAVETDFSCYYPLEPCDDANDFTINDAYTIDCLCAGEDISAQFGCNDVVSCNYDATAIYNDGSCIYPGETCDDGDPNSYFDALSADCICVGQLAGCMLADACNFDPLAGLDDGSCILPGNPCDDFNEATINDAINAECVCVGETSPILGCTETIACNYNPAAVNDDGSCISPGDLCDDGNPETLNDLLDNDCNCSGLLLGCTEIGACNYNPNAVLDNGSCNFPGDACDDNNSATTNDAYNSDCVCQGNTIDILGCIDVEACNFNMDANTDDGSCQFPLSACDDNNELTLDDSWSVDCVCAGLLAGCTEPGACNYNADAVIEDFSCAYPNGTCNDGDFTTINDTYTADCMCAGEQTELIPGCMEPGSCNFNPIATVDDGSCLLLGEACDDNNPATINDAIQADCICQGDASSDIGCTDNQACNFNPLATISDDSCIYPGAQCDDFNANTYNDSYNGDCVCAGTSYGCTLSTACNYDPLAGIDNGSCLFPTDLCDDGNPLTANDAYNADCVCMGTEVSGITGCMTPTACNYNADATIDDGSCLTTGDTCDDNDVTTDNDQVNADCVCMGVDNGLIGGCMDMNACNYDMAATIDDGSCYSIGDACDDGNIFTANDAIGADCMCTGEEVVVVEGCTASEACNYNPDANFDDGSCELPGSPCDDGDATTLFDALGFDCVCAGMPSGCMEPNACNYDATAMFDDSSCIFPGEPCDDGDANTVNDILNANCECSGEIIQVLGCISADACNYNAAANTDDGSCYFVGDTCDDGNANTSNDVYNANCQCEGVVSVEEMHAHYAVYPNPTGGILTIAQQEGEAMQLIEVVDITGKRVASFNPNSSVFTIDLNTLAAGLYTLHIRSNNEVNSVRVQKN
jgi:Secretion system C-terminal sorting domain